MTKISIFLALLICATANAADCSITSTGNTPLYPSIFVPRTAAQESAGLAAANSIPAGDTVLLSIGMSNASGIWEHFKNVAEADPLKSRDVRVVNGAQSGGAAESWAEKDLDKTWGELEESFEASNIAKRDVSVIWFMTANIISQSTQEEYAEKLETDVRATLDLFAEEFPNLKVVWIQSMIYAGYSTTSGNYEPFAWKTGAVAQSITASQDWSFFVGNGPYLWADGETPRADGLTWLCEDFKEDGNHPDDGAKDKHSDGLLQFFQEDSIARITYLDSSSSIQVPDVVDTDQATAESAITSAGLSVGTVTTAPHGTIVDGNVISQEPMAGSSATAGARVDLVVSLGPSLVSVPDVVGLMQTGAESTVVNAGLSVGVVTSDHDDNVPAGNVISQDPDGGSLVDGGTNVDLVVSLGPLMLDAPMMLTPVDGSTLAGSSEFFIWSGEGAAVTEWHLQVGTSAGSRNLYNRTFPPAVTSQLVGGLPTDGNQVFVTLKWEIGSESSEASYAYTAAVVEGEMPQILSPRPGSTLAPGSVSFQWVSNGTEVDDWQLLIGTSVGNDTWYDSGILMSDELSTVVDGLPEDGSELFVTLIWTKDGTASTANYKYTAAPRAPTVEAQSLFSLADVNGNNTNDFGILLRQLESAENFLVVVDGKTGSQISTLSLGTKTVSHGTVVPDANGDQVPEQGILIESSLLARVKDVVNGTLIGKPKFDADFEAFAFLPVRETILGDGPHLTVVGHNETNGEIQARVRNIASGDLITTIEFNGADTPVAAAILDDVGDSPAADIAVLSISGDGEVRAEVRDTESGNLVSEVSFSNAFTPLEFIAAPDSNGLLTRLAVLGKNTKGIIRAQIKKASDGMLVSKIKFSKDYDPVAFISFSDSNGNGDGEIAVLGTDETGDVRAQAKEMSNGAIVSSINFSDKFLPVSATGVHSAAGTGRNEIAVLGASDAGDLQMQVKDLSTGDLVFKAIVPVD